MVPEKQGLKLGTSLMAIETFVCLSSGSRKTRIETTYLIQSIQAKMSLSSGSRKTRIETMILPGN